MLSTTTEHAHKAYEARLQELDFQSYCTDALAQGSQKRASFVRLTVPAPSVSLLKHPNGSLLWSPPYEGNSTQWVSSGQAVCITTEGSNRFQEIQRRANRVWQGLLDVPWDCANHVPPRLFGGLSFAPKDAPYPWSFFGQARFWLPRVSYIKRGKQAWLSLCVPTQTAPSTAVQELVRHTRHLSQVEKEAPCQSQIEQIHHLDPKEWKRRIQGIQQEIRSGRVRKIVAARKSDVQFADEIELRPALERLTARYPDCYCFAFRCEEATFLGASPETLINKCGAKITTQALAGSIAATVPNADATLLESKKDRFEQGLVVHAITSALNPLCNDLHHPEVPETKTLRHVTHLCTPIEGTLSSTQHSSQHVLDLVDALHPTPAVGGWPSEPAMKWIMDNEEERGWYAAPVGWFDKNGDGEFAVAIRSALFLRSEAHIYAGAGIVADSDAELEFQETDLKQKAILDALGILG